MKVYRIEGAKNSFALVSFLDANTNEDPSGSLVQITNESSAIEALYKDKTRLSSKAKDLCKIFKTPVDGCIYIFPHQELDFAWEFFNSDGSDALMCGNAARAVSLWFNQFCKPKLALEFFTPAQHVVAQILTSSMNSDTKDGKPIAEGQICVTLNKTKLVAKEGDHVIYDSGVPHLCVYLNSTDANQKTFKQVGEKYFDTAKSLRYPKSLNSKGSNVTYIWADSEDAMNRSQIKAMSFERGVEDWTEACGTGAMAAAYYASDVLNMSFPINVQMPGGVLEINESEGKTLLTGPAVVLEILDIDTIF